MYVEPYLSEYSLRGVGRDPTGFVSKRVKNFI